MKDSRNIILVLIIFSLFTISQFTSCKKDTIEENPNDVKTTTPTDFRDNFVGNYICTQIVRESFYTPQNSGTTITTISTTDTVIVSKSSNSSIRVITPVRDCVMEYDSAYNLFEPANYLGDYTTFNSPDSIYVSQITGMFRFTIFFGKKF